MPTCQRRTCSLPLYVHCCLPLRMTFYVNLTCKVKLKGSVDAVTVISPPSSTKSNTLFSRFGRVAASNCGGAWKYNCFVAVDKDGLLIWLNVLNECQHNHDRIINAHILSFYQHLNKTFQSPVTRDHDFKGIASTDRTVITLLMLERVGINTVSAYEHEVIIEMLCCGSNEF
jgi:hypothetical protein